ncbi:prolyl 4-hydroxylase subunit alpha-1-like isoform X2 [Amphiura filiformis]
MWHNFQESPIMGLLWLLVTITLVDGDLFSSASRMATVVTVEEKLIREALDYVDKEQLRLAEIRKLIKQIHRERGHAVNDPKEYVNHPVQSFQLLRRFRRQWIGLKNYVSLNNNDQAYLSKAAALENSPGYPKEDDYIDGAKIILKLQDTYKLNTSLIGDGVITTRQPKAPPLLAEDCYELGIQAWNASSPEYVKQWMEEGLLRLRSDKPSEYDHYVGEVNILHQISASLYKQGSISEAIDIAKQILEIDPWNTAALDRKTVYEEKLRIMQASDPDSNEATMALCRNDNTYIKKKWRKQHKRSLYCHFTHYNRPRLFIRPAKVEVLNKKPPVIQFHDILTKKEMAFIKKTAEPHLSKSRVAIKTTDENTSIKPDQRKSSIAWMNIHQSHRLRSILPRVEDYTGLSTQENHTEYLQAAHYGVGGFYKQHFDDMTDEDSAGYEGLGKRIATVLFYMNDVPEGGGTVFPRAGVRASPIKGSAVFWYNFLKMGNGS